MRAPRELKKGKAVDSAVRRSTGASNPLVGKQNRPTGSTRCGTCQRYHRPGVACPHAVIKAQQGTVQTGPRGGKYIETPAGKQYVDGNGNPTQAGVQQGADGMYTAPGYVGRKPPTGATAQAIQAQQIMGGGQQPQQQLPPHVQQVTDSSGETWYTIPGLYTGRRPPPPHVLGVLQNQVALGMHQPTPQLPQNAPGQPQAEPKHAPPAAAQNGQQPPAEAQGAQKPGGPPVTGQFSPGFGLGQSIGAGLASPGGTAHPTVGFARERFQDAINYRPFGQGQKPGRDDGAGKR